MKRIKLFSILITLLICYSSFAQPKRKKNQIEYINSLQITGGLGTSTYFGDLCDNFDCAVFRPNSSIGLLYRNSERLMFRNEYTFVRLFGTDEGGENRSRNLHFKSNVHEVTWGVIYDIIPYERKFRYRPPFSPYLHGGIGFAYFNPKAEYNGKWYKLRPLQTEGKKYGNITPIVSYGVGARYKVSAELNIAAEIGYRWTFTDYLDDVSGTYVDNNSLSSDEAKALADRTAEADLNWEIKNRAFATGKWEAGHQRGNPNRKDGYFLFQIKAEYRIKWTSQGGSILRKSKFR